MTNDIASEAELQEIYEQGRLPLGVSPKPSRDFKGHPLWEGKNDFFLTEWQNSSLAVRAICNMLNLLKISYRREVKVKKGKKGYWYRADIVIYNGSRKVGVIEYNGKDHFFSTRFKSLAEYDDQRDRQLDKCSYWMIEHNIATCYVPYYHCEGGNYNFIAMLETVRGYLTAYLGRILPQIHEIYGSVLDNEAKARKMGFRTLAEAFAYYRENWATIDYVIVPWWKPATEQTIAKYYDFSQSVQAEKSLFDMDSAESMLDVAFEDLPDCIDLTDTPEVEESITPEQELGDSVELESESDIDSIETLISVLIQFSADCRAKGITQITQVRKEDFPQHIFRGGFRERVPITPFYFLPHGWWAGPEWFFSLADRSVEDAVDTFAADFVHYKKAPKRGPKAALAPQTDTHYAEILAEYQAMCQPKYKAAVVKPEPEIVAEQIPIAVEEVVVVPQSPLAEPQVEAVAVEEEEPLVPIVEVLDLRPPVKADLGNGFSLKRWLASAIGKRN
jgi:hypothetical protein